MARIRTIKPEFPHSESMGRVSREARLLFILLWTLADDVGRLRGNSRILASLLYPYDDDAKKLVPIWLEELEKEDCIRLYLADDSVYLQVLNWGKHQKIDKPSKSRSPEFVESSRVLARDPRVVVGGSGSGPGSGPGSRKGKDQTPKPPEGVCPEAFQEWLDYRVKIGKAVKTVSYDDLWKKMQTLGDFTLQLAAVRYSKAQGWTGLFQDKADRQRANGFMDQPAIPTKTIEQLKAEGHVDELE